MSNPRRRGGRGPDFGRRDQNWGSPRSGSPGSPGINGSPRTGRRDHRDKRSELPLTDHDCYVDYLKRRWISVRNQRYVTFYKDTDYKPAGETVVQPTFNVERFFEVRQQQQQERQVQQPLPSNPQSQNVQGLPS